MKGILTGINIVLVASMANFIGVSAFAQTLSPQVTPTTFPISLTRTISTNHAKPGEPIVGVLVQPVTLPNSKTLRKGTEFRGHVTATSSSYEDGSKLGIQFDGFQDGSEFVPMTFSLRAMADRSSIEETEEAPPSDMDSAETLTLVGGDSYSSHFREVVDSDGAVVGHNSRDGVRSRLKHTSNCPGSETEQAVGRFSASACGLYGFGNVSLSESRSGLIELSAPSQWITVARGSSFLLQVIQPRYSAQSNVAKR
jgi:hypothetical protein